MKDCIYFQEQIMLKFYNEDFDGALVSHITNCENCRNFENELIAGLSLSYGARHSDNLNAINRNILSAKSDNPAVSHKWKFRLTAPSLYKYATAAVLLIICAVLIIPQINKTNLFNSSVSVNTNIQKSNKPDIVKLTTFNIGGDNANIFSDFEKEIEKIENELEKFIKGEIFYEEA